MNLSRYQKERLYLADFQLTGRSRLKESNYQTENKVNFCKNELICSNCVEKRQRIVFIARWIELVIQV